MYVSLLEQRDIVANAIKAVAGTLILPFDVKATVYRASFRVQTLDKNGQCKLTVCGLGFDETAGTRSTKDKQLQIQVAIEAAYTTDTQAENYIKLTEQIATVCSGLDSWIANRMSMDEHGLPYQFHVAREQSVYQSIFDAVYNAKGRRFHEGASNGSE